MYPLFNSKKVEPFDDEYIYPGNRLIAFELNQQWFPGRINIDSSEEKIRGDINPVPYWVRNWQSLEHKQNSIDFAKHDFWSENKSLIAIIVTAVVVGVVLFVVAYYTYQHIDKMIPVLQQLGESVKQNYVIEGTPP